MPILRYLDVAVVLIGAVPAILLGAPALGYALGGATWIAQRLIALNEQRLLLRVEEPRRYLGARLGSSFGRIWLLAGAIIAAGVAGGRTDGLTAAIVIFAAYSIAFSIRILSGPPERRTS